MNTPETDKNSLLEKKSIVTEIENADLLKEKTIEPISKKTNPNLSKEDLLDALKKLLKLEEVDKNEVDTIKQSFYKKVKAENAEILKDFIAKGGDKESFVPKEDALEIELKKLLSEFKDKRTAQAHNVLKEKEDNLKAKYKILDELNSLTDDLDNVENINEAILSVRKLQQEWKSIGPVNQENVNELWKKYQLYIEKFYDYIKITNDLREYDLKKNLEIKTQLCESVERLVDEQDVLTAFRTLQKFHDEWRETGPVVRELRDEIWERFKVASAIINKKHQSFFDEKKGEEEKHLSEKVAICEYIESIDYLEIKTYKNWDDKTKEIIEIQSKWKQIGYAPKKVNVKIYERFRKACDDFFKHKNEFFQVAKDELQGNLDKKIDLCVQAEALKSSTEWKETSDKLIKIQKEWKTIGPVPRKQSDAIWKRFIEACDYFFVQRDKETSDEKTIQQKNLQLKTEIVEKIENLVIDKDPQGSIQTLKNYIAEWNKVGFVPFKDKDKALKAFKKATDEQFERLHVDQNNRRLHMFKGDLDDASEGSQHKFFREREKLKKELDHLKTEIATYENNIGFFSSSKKASKMIQEIEQKIDKLKEQKDLIVNKIEIIEGKL